MNREHPAKSIMNAQSKIIKIIKNHIFYSAGYEGNPEGLENTYTEEDVVRLGLITFATVNKLNKLERDTLARVAVRWLESSNRSHLRAHERLEQLDCDTCSKTMFTRRMNAFKKSLAEVNCIYRVYQLLKYHPETSDFIAQYELDNHVYWLSGATKISTSN